MALERDIKTLRRKVEEVVALSDLYDELVSDKPKSAMDLESTKLEAKFARDELLRLSLEVRELIVSLETKESMK